MPVVYVVLCHRSPRYVAELARALEHPDQHVILHADAKAPPALHELVARLAGPNVHVLEPELCSWGGWSLVAATLRAIGRALELRGWRHLALLSEQHIPLQPPDTIAAMLPDGVSFSDAASLPELAPAVRADVLHRFAHVWRELPGVGMFAAGTRAVDARALRLGSQWVVLARDACERLAAAAESVWAPFRSSLVPDETALMSVLRGPLGHGLEIRRTSASFVAWPHLGGDADSQFTDDQVRAARARGFLFIRKRPNRLPQFARALHGPPIFLSEPAPVADPRAATLAVALRRMLAGRFPDLTVREAAGPFACLTFRTDAMAPALSVVLVSYDHATFKVLLAWRRPFDGSLLPISLGGYVASVMGARLPELITALEVHLPELADFGFVPSGDAAALAGPVATALAIGRRISGLVGRGFPQ